MLLDQIGESSGLTYPGGLPHDALMAPLRARLARARPFVFGPEAVRMAAGVAMGRPSSMVAALPWVRLPAEWTWIEFANPDLRQAMAALGSPNVTPPNAQVQVARTGFLLREDAGDLVMDYVHADRTAEGRVLADLAPVRLRFELDPGRPVPEAVPRAETDGKTSGRVRRHLKLISEDPVEAGAEASLRERFFWGRHPDLAPVAEMLAERRGEEFVRETEEAQAADAWRMFHAFLLPALILLNCRNAVDVEQVEPSAKLNRTRAAKGRPALRAHGLVRMHLTASRRARSAASGAARGAVASAFVIGHFKVRSGGIYWWSPHVRIGSGDPVRRTTVVDR